ncbi:MAG: uroporphyrinogen decarboxylase [Gammaproteobacteria bacterium]|jgi:uroporphyrinogen decarboxylase|nr:uroporphyrinogen decarboxylase [Gammaproteobacteria bacterium]MBT3726012.1 uroporphyrinogen decarboxylase [Gammaproteobacteria bacterium]MBT4075143.1 uroporphyrinogen decarboxylase [Gammaproteobacteria bacterium]MBT4195285.1 uroporphyrinogen decarboxylase [Gammaproteobacteria bacterium]MBT4448628.1 uroporphyrinogen decarboxylase [Gammaproteobacteria bacterium]
MQFPALKNDRYLKALLKQETDTTPVWIMRQAGRYLPEYKETRKQAGSFLDLCMNPELACEVTLQPLRRFDLDAAILFSDILTIPDAMDLGLYFSEGEGPKFKHPIRSQADINKLFVPDPSEKLRYVTDAVTLIRQELGGQVPLIGFSGSPWTLATYMIEGGSSKDYHHSKGLMYENPKALHQILDVIAKSVVSYLNAQIEAGAQSVMIFDTWGGVLSPEAYQEFSLRYMQQIVDQLHREYDGQTIPVTLFTKGGGQWIELIADTGCNGVGLDWTLSIDEARKRVGDKVALQGNLDPNVLYAAPETIRQHAKQLIEKFGNHTGHVFNLGHGIHQTVNPDNLKVLVDAVHEFGREIRKA